mmetsp:Transcript_20837/g.53181  ORF Transcript_20837/g.53181 Transcript_20837/m.53181 type:complete len:251 (-) Transcript_20837:810-1562(-)
MLELDEHGPKPAGAVMHVEGLARLLECSGHLLRAHLEQHRFEEDFPLLPVGAPRTLEELACVLGVAAELMQARLLEHHQRARLWRRLGVRALQEGLGDLELSVAELCTRAAQPDLPAQVGCAVGNRAHVGCAGTLKLAVALLDLRTLEPKFPDQVLGDVLDTTLDEGPRGAHEVLRRCGRLVETQRAEPEGAVAGQLRETRLGHVQRLLQVVAALLKAAGLVPNGAIPRRVVEQELEETARRRSLGGACL